MPNWVSRKLKKLSRVGRALLLVGRKKTYKKRELLSVHVMRYDALLYDFTLIDPTKSKKKRSPLVVEQVAVTLAIGFFTVFACTQVRHLIGSPSGM